MSLAVLKILRQDEANVLAVLWYAVSILTDVRVSVSLVTNGSEDYVVICDEYALLQPKMSVVQVFGICRSINLMEFSQLVRSGLKTNKTLI
jgi:hypothetical protein